LARVGVLTGNIGADGGAQMRVQAFKQGLADVGWIENDNLQLEVRWPGPNIAAQEYHARELIALLPVQLRLNSTR
jgi:putative tryptophan/tyrosine transport system substrate-binding protein